MTVAIRNGFKSEQTITRRPCRRLRVTTVVIVKSGKLEMRSLLRLSCGGRKERQCSRGRIAEYRRKPPILVPAVHPFSVNFFALAGHHGLPCCVEVQWRKLPMNWRRAEHLNELPETALAPVINNH